MKLIAIHQIGIGNPSASGALTFVQPGKPFEVDDQEGAFFIENGAARLAPKDESTPSFRSASPVVETAVVDDIASPDPAPLDEEAEFEALKAQAEALGLTVRKGTKPETIRKRIREAKAENAAADEGGEDLL